MGLSHRLLPSFVDPYRPGDEVRIPPPPLDHAERILDLLSWPERVHRYEVQGMEHVPREGPGLIVSSHPYFALGMFLFGKRIYEAHGRIVRGLTDHVVWSIPLFRDVFATLGVVDGTPENGAALLADGQLAACMPGGAREWSRSFRQRRTLLWGNHRGYARIAVATGAPVIPTACPGADRLYVVLNDGWRAGKRVRRALGLGRTWPLPLAVGLGPLPFPAKLVQYVAPPEWPALDGDDESRVRDLDHRVRRSVQALLTR